MRRRDLLAGLLLATEMRVAVHARPSGEVSRIAVLHPSAPVADISETGDHPYFPVFFQELRRLGYNEGRNLVVDRYSGEGRIERHAELAHIVVGSKPDVILAISPHMMLPRGNGHASYCRDYR
jgi:putative tryptophan/tyrosine transport system substrate-binding protein